MSKSKQGLADKLLIYGTSINNALNDIDIATALNELGFTSEKVTVGLDMFTEVDQLVKKQQAEYGEQYEATDELNKLAENLKVVYERSFKIAKLVFATNLSATNAMQLSGNRKRSLSGWLQQVESFYGNLLSNADFVTAMGEYAYTEEKLLAEQAFIAPIKLAKQKQDKEKGEAQQSTLDRNKKLSELEFWVSDFVKIARLALTDHPQWLEKLGILEKTK